VSDLINRIQAAQVQAGEAEVIRDLVRRGLAKAEDHPNLFPPAEVPSQDSKRFRWIVDNPISARHLLNLLALGKGDKESFIHMIDRVILSEEKARAALKP
jgi:hypothetical protein